MQNKSVLLIFFIFYIKQKIIILFPLVQRSLLGDSPVFSIISFFTPG